MENIFQLNGNELEEFHKAINLIARYYNYHSYKWFWNIVIKKSIALEDIAGILTLERPHAFIEESTTDQEYEAYKRVYNFLLDTLYHEIGKHCEVEEIDTYDEEYSKNPYYVGYKISYEGRSLCFYDGYTGVAGCHWDTVAFEYWYE